MKQLYCVPPDPNIMSMLYMEYLRVAKDQGFTFSQYLEKIGYTNHSRNIIGMDDGKIAKEKSAGLDLIGLPSHLVTGVLRIIVLLIDFPDRKGYYSQADYEDLLFSRGTHPTGSMFDYFNEVTLGNVELTGSVHGWYRMPHRYSYYTNGESGIYTEIDINGKLVTHHPHNAQHMAEDAVKIALKNGVTFGPELDVLGNGTITGLFIIHAGRGAEVMPHTRMGSEIWSHKWELEKKVVVRPGLEAKTYLTVPEDCNLGVCAHELGHLVFQWEDFYDTNDKDGSNWGGSGRWDLMASGNYNGCSAVPAHPAGLHKSQHGWIDVETITSSQSLTLEPYTRSSGKIVKIISPKYGPGQYLILENRSRIGFDRFLPGEGLLVWRVDESCVQTKPDKPALLLVQADGLHQLEQNILNQGDEGDPFPGSTSRTNLGDTGPTSTSFPFQQKSGISLLNISHDPRTGNITLDVEFSNP